MRDRNLSMWTASVDYFATGEGRSVMGRIGYASSEEAAREEFGKAFGQYFAEACSVEAGVVRNKVTQLLRSEAALAYFEAFDLRGAFEAVSRFHFNLS